MKKKIIEIFIFFILIVLAVFLISIIGGFILLFVAHNKHLEELVNQGEVVF